MGRNQLGVKMQLSHDIYMVDAPKETNGDEATEDNPSKKKAKHGRRPRHSKPRQGNTGTGDENNPDGAEDKNNPAQPGFVQANREDGQASPKEQATDGESKDDNYMPLSEDEVRLGNKEFIVLEDPVEQQRSKLGL